MKQISTFFERILQILDYYNIKSINSFATEHLKYDSSEKINRLKTPGASPSFQILCDITNKFEEIDARWLITGKGKMINSDEKRENKEEIFINSDINLSEDKSFFFFFTRYETLAYENGVLKEKVTVLEKEIEKIPKKATYKIPKSGSKIAAEPNP